MTGRQIGGWVAFTALLCVVAAVAVVLVDEGGPPTAIPAPRATAVVPAAVKIIDGDTLELAGRRIRLWGIDAPELPQTCQGRDGQPYGCGRDAAAALGELTRNRAVMCDDERDRDQYGRVVAVCRTDAGEINATMVRSGWAIDFTRFSGGRYLQEQAAAQAASAGMWAGRFNQPAEWRREERRNGGRR
jgi:endonuclease YncB( thermonuclease family)